MSRVINLTDAAEKLGRIARDVRTVVLLENIPTQKVGHNQVVDDDGLQQLEQAFARIDVEAEKRGMKGIRQRGASA